MSSDDIDRRSVLRTGGAALASLTGLSLVGGASAAPEESCLGCDDGGDGGGGGGGTSVSKPAVRTIGHSVSGNEFELVGALDDTGGADTVDVWFKWGPEGDGCPYDTPPQYLSYPDEFTHSEEHWSGTYEYKAAASNEAGLATGGIKTFTI